MKMPKKRGVRLAVGLILAAIPLLCLVLWALWEHPDWFGGDSLYKPLSDCPLPAPTVPALSLKKIFFKKSKALTSVLFLVKTLISSKER